MTQEQYEVMLRFEGVYWKAFLKPGFPQLRNEFDASFTDDELKQRTSCILHHTMIGSTPPKNNAPYAFDINGKYEGWILKLEGLVSKE